jgi:endonuclease/exonuclease/phosphatase (EEP) superfamily protein YafD
MIDIDHVFVTDGLQAVSARSVAVPGTDHLGLLVTVAVTTGP